MHTHSERAIRSPCAPAHLAAYAPRALSYIANALAAVCACLAGKRRANLGDAAVERQKER